MEGRSTRCPVAHMDGSADVACTYWSNGKSLNSGRLWYSSSPVLYLSRTSQKSSPHFYTSQQAFMSNARRFRTHMKWRYAFCASGGRASTQARVRGLDVN